MIIERFGIRLSRIGESDLPQLREWRNLPNIRQQMVFRELITPEMQRAWYASLDKAKNYYFVIEVGGDRIGVVNIKDVDLAGKSGEWGIYIVDEERGALAATKSAIMLLDFAFDDLELERVRATVLRSNERAIRLNVALGMLPVSTTMSDVEQYEVSAAGYRAARPRFSAILR